MPSTIITKGGGQQKQPYNRTKSKQCIKTKSRKHTRKPDITSDKPYVIVTRHQGMIDWLLEFLSSESVEIVVRVKQDRHTRDKSFLVIDRESGRLIKSIPILSRVGSSNIPMICGATVIGKLSLKLAAKVEELWSVEFSSNCAHKIEIKKEYTKEEHEKLGAHLRLYRVRSE